jgi:hypothetical protein
MDCVSGTMIPEIFLRLVTKRLLGNPSKAVGWV